MSDTLQDELRDLACEWVECCGDIHLPLTKAADRIDAQAATIEALEAENARQTHELKKLRIALSTYENKVQEYASEDWARSDHAYDWLNEDAGETARAALRGDTGDLETRPHAHAASRAHGASGAFEGEDKR